MGTNAGIRSLLITSKQTRWEFQRKGSPQIYLNLYQSLGPLILLVKSGRRLLVSGWPPAATSNHKI